MDPRSREMVTVEGLESRELFAATTGPNFVAVLARAQALAADQLSVTQHRSECDEKLAASRAAVEAASANGKSLIAADKAAVAANRGNPTLLAQAKQQLAADKAQVKADVAAAKVQLKQDQTACRADAREHAAALKQETAGLRTDLKATSPETRNAVKRLVADFQSMQVGGDVTSADLQALSDSLKAAADGATEPTEASVQQFLESALGALTDGTVSDEETVALRAASRDVFSTAGVPADESDALVDNALLVFSKLNLSQAQLLLLGADLQDVYRSFTA